MDRALRFFVLGILLSAVSVSAQLQSQSLTGQVVDDMDSPLPGVTVSLGDLTDPATIRSTTVTNADGQFRIFGIAPGDYEAMFELVGFEPIRRAVSIMGGRQTLLNLSLSFNADPRQPGQRVLAPRGVVEKSTLAPYSAWSFGNKNLLLYQLEPGSFAYAVGPSACGSGTVTFDSTLNLDPQIKEYKDSDIHLLLSGGIVQSFLVWDGSSMTAAQPIVTSGTVFSSRELPPFTVVPPGPSSGLNCTPRVYLYSEWTGHCLIDVWGCRFPLQNQVRSIACCFSSGGSTPPCEKYLGSESSQ